MDQFKGTLAESIWDYKYRYRQGDKIIDHTIEDTWARVAKAIALAEGQATFSHWNQQFYSILEDFRYLPGGRILAGAGTKNKVTLFNCFVMNIEDDSLPSIFEALKEGALTLQQGGGIGYDFSVLRPRGYVAKQTGVTSSGPVSFMQIWDTMSSILLSTGARRGAMMGIMRCDHPDIEEFVAAKADAKMLRHFNVSVFVSDAFMQAVKENREWPLIFPLSPEEAVEVAAAEASGEALVYRRWSNTQGAVPCHVYKRVSARELWDKITRSAYDYAEPGVLFENTINRMNNLWYCEHIAATNPCGEIPLPAYGACNLGALNLTRFVIAPFSPTANLDWKAIERTVEIATRFQDNVIDVSLYPLKQQKEEALSKRRIGLGLTGLADALVMLGVKYGSAKAVKISQEIMKLIANTTWLISVELAKERGAFPAFQKEAFCSGQFITKLDPAIGAAVAEFGIRNSHHNTIAPAGTISILANNISSGLEPIFAGEYRRVVRMEGNENRTVTVTDYALALWRQNHAAGSFPPAWQDTHSLQPLEHLQLQAAVQPFVDNAISKTINIPTDYPFEALAEVYTQAFAMGLKGCTVFRANPITGSILTEEDPQAQVDRCNVCLTE